jgi:hypothetical protein
MELNPRVKDVYIRNWRILPLKKLVKVEYTDKKKSSARVF